VMPSCLLHKSETHLEHVQDRSRSLMRTIIKLDKYFVRRLSLLVGHVSRSLEMTIGVCKIVRDGRILCSARALCFIL